MALSAEELLNVQEILDELCRSRSGEEVRVATHIRGNRITLVESRPLFIDPGVMNDVNVAQFEFDPDRQIWTLYWYDRKNRRQPYPTGRNRDTFTKLISEVDTDPTGIFWD